MVRRGSAIRLGRAVLIALVGLPLLAALDIDAAAQTLTSATDSTTPLGLAQGAPAGSFELSGFESVNPYNGNLSFHLPLLHIGGRGGAQTTLALALNTKSWRVEHIIEQPGTQNPIDVFYPVKDTWWSLDPGYGPGVMEGRHSGLLQLQPPCAPSQTKNPLHLYTVTQLTFRTSDGTEYQFRDTLTDGQPATVTSLTCAQPGQRGSSRGTVFASTGGEAITFISDTTIYDDAIIIGTAADHIFPSGIMMLRDGTQYRIDAGLVSWIRDRNGNSITFQYDPSFSRVTSITSSLGITVTVGYSLTDPQLGNYDQISYKGFGGTQRAIKIFRGTLLSGALRPDQTGVQTLHALFPEQQMNGATDQTNFNPAVVTHVLLPDGVRSYNLLYNTYAELARVTLPTGGMIDYDAAPGSGTLVVGDCSVPGDPTCNPVQIYRRVAKRTVYPNGSAVEGSMAFDQTIDSIALQTTTTITHYAADGQTVLAKDVHIFYGSASGNLFVTSNGGFYPAWNEGKEFQTDLYDPARGKLKSTVSAFQQRVQPEPAVSWWPGWVQLAAQQTFYPGPGEPPKDPQLISATTTLVDTNEVSKVTYAYDQFNNVTDQSEYDFGPGHAGSLLRDTQTQYVGTNNGVDYRDPPAGVHIRNLPSVAQISDAGGLRAETDYEYDNYTPETPPHTVNHAALTARSSMVGGDTNLSPSAPTIRSSTAYLTRGNATAITRKVLTDSTSRIRYSQYDVAGNVVVSIDPNSNKTLIDFSDNFGSPDGEATTNTPPSELSGGLFAFAFPTKVTNPLGFISHVQYDYYIGRPVDAQDINGLVSSASYADPFDRQTSITRGSSQTDPHLSAVSSVTYQDSIRTITVTSDRDTKNDGILKTQTVYDGLGRTTDTIRYESPSSLITISQTYDGMGRTITVSNAYRTGDSQALTTTQYDGLSRPITVTGPDNSVVGTAYSGSKTTVTDQAGAARASVVDGLGRLHSIAEDPNGLNYQTTYSYDGLGDLNSVTQGAQQRTFTYDGLSELLTASNPEQVNTSGVQVATVYTYDNNGNLTNRANPNGTSIGFVYDALNRVSKKTLSVGGTFIYAYDASANGKGKLTSVVLQGSSTGDGYFYDVYDVLGRATTARQITLGNTYSMTYGYNLTGAMTSEQYPSGKTVTSTYDGADRLNQVQSGVATYASNMQYTAHGAVQSMSLGNGLVEHTTYNQRLQPTLIGLGTSTSDSSTFRLDYTYGLLVNNTLDLTKNNGNPQSQAITAGTTLVGVQSYTYDKLNRLAAVAEAASAGGQSVWSQTYSYDQYGNMAVTASPGMPVVPMTPQDLSAFDPATNRIKTSSYDTSGNQLADGFGGGYSYDSDNYMTTCTVNGLTSNYVYDGNEHRVQKTVGSTAATIFVYDIQGKLVAEYGGQTASSNAGTSYLTTDHLGSTRTVTDSVNSQAHVVARHDYLPFGGEIGTVGGRTAGIGYGGADDTLQKFTSKERDNESLLDYFGARYYSPTLGRFTSIDPLGVSLSKAIDPQQLNRYGYVRNNPLKYQDADGRELKLDPKLSKQDAERLLKYAANMYRKPAGREALQRLEKSDIKFVVTAGSLKDGKVDLFNQTQAIVYGETKPTSGTLLEKDGKPIGVKDLTVTITVDLQKIDRQPEGDKTPGGQTVFTHEVVGHGQDFEKNPVEATFESQEDSEKHANDNVKNLQSDKRKEDMKQQEAEAEVREMFGLPPKEQKKKHDE